MGLVDFLTNRHFNRLQKSLTWLYPDQKTRAEALVIMAAQEIENTLFLKGKIVRRIEIEPHESGEGYILFVEDNSEEE